MQAESKQLSCNPTNTVTRTKLCRRSTSLTIVNGGCVRFDAAFVNCANLDGPDEEHPVAVAELASNSVQLKL